MFCFRGDPPFEDGFQDYAIYLRALTGEQADEAVVHFKAKIASCNPDNAGPAPAQTLVALLARLARYDEAIAVSLDHLRDLDPNQLLCPSVFELCQAAGDYSRLRSLARERGDLLHFAAAALEG
jgi:hypothetical protein